MPGKMSKLLFFVYTLVIYSSIHAQMPKLMLPIAHAADIRASTISPDGKKLVTGADDKTSKIWDIGTGKLLADLDAKNKMPIFDVTFSPDGKKIITSSYDRNSSIWSAATGKLLNILNRDAAGDNKGRSENPDGAEVGFSTIKFSPDNKRILTYDDLYPTVRIWNAETGTFLFALKELHEGVKTVIYSPDKERILTATSNGFTIWNAATGMVRKRVDLYGKKNAADIGSAQFSADGKQVITYSFDGTHIIWNAETGVRLKTLGNAISNTELEFNNADPKKMLGISRDSTIHILNGNYDIVKSFLPPTGKPYADAKFTPDGKKIIASSTNGTITIWDAVTYALLKIIPVLSTQSTGFYISADSKKILTDSVGSMGPTPANFMIWDIETGKLLAGLMDTAHEMSYKSFTPDGKKLVAVLNDNTIKIWDANSGELLYDVKAHIDVSKIRKIQYAADGKELATSYTVYPFDTNDSLIMTTSGYYQCTPGAAKLLHYVTPDLKVISFEQLDVKYNRPDKVLQATGNTDTALINSYRNAYVKRINKLGIDTAAFNNNYGVPEADFANRNDIKLEQTNPNLTLQLIASDSNYTLDRYHIWINEVPLFGQRGVSVRSADSKSLNKNISIQLSPGDNRIETSVINTNGIESYRMPLFVKYIAPAAVASKVYFIGIGINAFADSSRNLTWCVQDIRDLTTAMQSKYGSSFSVMDTLYNQQVTLSGIQLLKKKLLNTSINDKVIIAFSGHGLLSKSYDYYLSSYNINFYKPEDAGIPYDAIESLLDSIPARKKILLLDACHSGEVDKEELKSIAASKTALVKNKVVAVSGNRGLVGGGGDEGSGKLGLQNSFELMQNLFVNVGKGTGAIIISASGGVQFAQERSELGHGVFTYSVIEAMKNNEHMKVADFKKYVGNRVIELTNGFQKPTARNETIAVNWDIW